jgi:hypothetical protein
MKMAVFWVVAPCSLVEVYDISEVIAVSIIRATSLQKTVNLDVGKDFYSVKVDTVFGLHGVLGNS